MQQQSGSDSAPLVVKTIEVSFNSCSRIKNDYPFLLQHLEEDYGSYTWPCAPVLAQYIYSQREFINGKKVLEVRQSTERCILCVPYV